MGLYDNIRILQHQDQLQLIEQGKWGECPPLHVRLEPSEVCNFRCCFCWWHNREKREQLDNFSFDGRRLMDTARLLSLLEELAAMGTKAVSFTGAGDPLMHPDMAEVLDKASSLGLVFGATSNMAMPMTDALVEALVKAKWLRWSLNAGTGSYLAVANPKGGGDERLFERMKENIRRIAAAAGRQRRRPEFNASYVVTDINQADVFEAAKLAASLGVDSIAFRPDTPLERQDGANEYSPEVLALIRAAEEQLQTDSFRVYSSLVRQEDVRRQNDPELLCFYSNHTVYIDARGDVYPCCYTRYDARYVIGNIMEQEFREFWNSAERRNFYLKLPQDGCPACGYGRINQALKPLYLGHGQAKEIADNRQEKDWFI